MIKRKIFVIFCSMLLVLLTGSVAMAAGTTDWEGGFLQEDGYGVVPAGANSAGQARALARRAAIVDAYRNLAEYVQGVNVDAETTVRDLAVESDVIQTKVSAVVKGARIVSEQMENDGTYHVVMQIPLYGVRSSLASAVLPANPKPAAFPQPEAVRPASSEGTVQPVPSAGGTTPQPAAGGSSAAPVPAGVNIQATGGYTGLVIDCRGLGLKPLMSPVIRNANGTPIYGYKNLDSAAVIANGMAGYASDMARTTRAGSHPLVVSAQSLEGHQGNPVISVEDANRILVENQSSGFLDRCAVVFLR